MLRGATMHGIYLIGPAPRPFSGDVVEHLWGPGRNYDSDEYPSIIANETVSEPRRLNRGPRSLVHQKP